MIATDAMLHPFTPKYFRVTKYQIFVGTKTTTVTRLNSVQRRSIEPPLLRIQPSIEENVVPYSNTSNLLRRQNNHLAVKEMAVLFENQTIGSKNRPQCPLSFFVVLIHCYIPSLTI